MRWVFVGIVSLNLLYFMWRVVTPDQAGDVEGRAAVSAVAEYPARLQLLAERPAAPGQSPTPAVAPVLSRAPAPGCPAIGPFGDEDEAAPVLEAFAARGLDASVDAAARKAAPVYWVYMAPLPGRPQALRKLRELQAKGIDSFVVTEGADINAISLGSFANRDSALGVQARLRAAGYAADIREQVREVQQSWVVLADPQAQGFFEFVPRSLQSQVRLERKPCLSRR